MNTDFHEFKTDEGIVHHLIYSQHGDLSTGLNELVCNGEDSGATEVRIILSSDGFIVSDNGKGFQSEEDVLTYFKTFGLRHEEGDAKFGRFRIGRGQIMSFSDAVWRSNEFEMHTKVKDGKYGFDFVKNVEKKVNGCEVSGSFNKGANFYLYGVTESIKRALKYMAIPVYLNSILINSGEPEWDYEDEECKICWNPGHADGVRFYSQGVFVKEVPEYMLGLCADVVTKKALSLNMARNEIRSEDKLYQKINKIILDESRKRAVTIHKGRNLNENLRRSLIKQLLNGELDFYDASKMSLIKDCRGHTIALSRLTNDKIPLTICESSEDIRKAEFFATAGLATVLHHNELAIWGFEDLEDMLEELISLSYDSRYNIRFADYMARVNIIDFNELSGLDYADLRIVENKTLKPRETAAKNALQAATTTMAKRLNRAGFEVDRRKVIIGESYVADGWTDAVTFIAVSKHMLKLLDSGYPGAFQLSLLLLHEYVHNENSANNPDHDFDFYKTFHDLASSHKNEIVGNVAKTMLGRYEKELDKKQLALPKSSATIPGTVSLDFIVGDKGLSELSKFVMGMTEFNIKVRSGKGNILTNHHTIYHPKKSVHRSIIQYLNSQGYVEEMFKKDSDEKYDFTSRRERMVKQWLHDKGYDDRDVIAKKLLNVRDPLDLIQFICMDKNSSIKSYEMKDGVVIHVNGSDDHHFSHITKNHGSVRHNYWGSRRTKNFETQSLRLEEVKGAIKDLVGGLSEEDKKLFGQTFFTEDFQKELSFPREED